MAIFLDGLWPGLPAQAIGQAIRPCMASFLKITTQHKWRRMQKRPLCDNCGKHPGVDLGFPDGWIVVERWGFLNTCKTWFFCSGDCLAKWMLKETAA